MKLIFHQYDDLPKLSWCAVLKRGSGFVKVHHGSGVETTSLFFAEGAWDGCFAQGELDESIFLAGSGGRLIFDAEHDTHSIIFATPSHILERLFSMRTEDVFYISNSLPFILTITGSALDLNYLDYERDFNSILRGLSSYIRVIPLKDGKMIRVHYYSNIKVDGHLNITEMEKWAIPKFESYEDYYSRLLVTLEKLVANSQSRYRKEKYGMVTTISKGYDAPACAAIARELGCEKCVSFNRPDKYASDCGTDIARILGYIDIITGDAEEYLTNQCLAEAEFVSSGELGSGIIFSTFEKEFAGNIVFLGERGDKIWDKKWPNPNKEFRFDNEVFTGTSWSENRLRVGYILLPVPLFGAYQWPSISKISKSREMSEFSVGGEYDRPIPRKILASKGVPGDMFALQKMGAGFNYRWDNMHRIKKRMAPKSYTSFRNFIKQNKRSPVDVLAPYIRFLWSSKEQYLSYFLGKIGITYKAKATDAEALVNPGAPSYLFPWAVQEMMKRYKT